MISVIVPTFNSEETIEACLDSLLNQSFSREYEILVVDDGSKDGTQEILDNYRSKKIRVLIRDHKGPAAARNLGAKEANGNLILFTDSDCIAERNWVDEMIRPFEDDGIVGVQGRYKTRQSEIVARFAQYEIEERYERMLGHRYIDFVGSYSAAYRRDIFLNEGGFDESFSIASGEDPDLSFRLASKGHKMVFNPRAIVFHRHPDSLKEYLIRKFYRAYWRVPLYRKNYTKTIRDSYTPQLLKIQIVLFYLFALVFVLNFIWRFHYLLILVLLALFLTTLPLTIKIIRKDVTVGLASPIIVFFRTFVFSLGLIYGAIKIRQI